MPGALRVEPGGQGEHLLRRRERADQQDLGQLAVDQLLEQPGRVGGQPAGGQHVHVAVGRLLHAQDEVLVGCAEHHAGHE